MATIGINDSTDSFCKFTDGKLQHMLQLAEIRVQNYAEAIKNYPPDRMEMYGKPHMMMLEERANVIRSILTSRGLVV